MSTQIELLIVEQDEASRAELTRKFIQLGYQVTPVCHTRHALEAATFRFFDAAILAYKCDQMGFPSFIRQLQRIGGRMPIVVLVDDPVDPIAEDRLRPNVDAILRWPCQMRRVTHAIEKALRVSSPAEDTVKVLDAPAAHDESVPS